MTYDLRRDRASLVFTAIVGNQKLFVVLSSAHFFFILLVCFDPLLASFWHEAIPLTVSWFTHIPHRQPIKVKCVELELDFCQNIS